MKKRLLSDYRMQVGAIMLLVVLGISIRAYATRNIEYTDNATVQCNLIDVVSEVNGVIKDIAFVDDQWTEHKDLLIQIEDSMFRAELQRAKSELEIQESSYQEALNSVELLKIDIETNLQKASAELNFATAILKSSEASIEEAKRELQASTADLDYLEDTYRHTTRLHEKQMTSATDYKNAKRIFDSKQASHYALESKVIRIENMRDADITKVFNAERSLLALQQSKDRTLKNAEARANTAQASIGVARAEYDRAALNLERTTIRAKRSGFISNRRISSGDYIEIGQPIASIVSCHDRPWVQANFKETQLKHMTQGQRVEFSIDTYPDLTFEGVVESISSGSGSTFSVLPPENASGNFTKVVKRMPVRISVSNPSEAIFRIGASATVTVFVQ